MAAAGAGMTTLAGWKEYAAFPELGAKRVRVKLDTGARTTAIGADRCVLVARPDGGTDAKLTLVLNPRRPKRRLVVRVPVVGYITVRGTGGTPERRPLIETTIVLGCVTKRIRATIADRSQMISRVILGRTTLGPEFAVDPSRKFLLS